MWRDTGTAGISQARALGGRKIGRHVGPVRLQKIPVVADRLARRDRLQEIFLDVDGCFGERKRYCGLRFKRERAAWDLDALVLAHAVFSPAPVPLRDETFFVHEISEPVLKSARRNPGLQRVGDFLECDAVRMAPYDLFDFNQVLFRYLFGHLSGFLIAHVFVYVIKTHINATNKYIRNIKLRILRI